MSTARVITLTRDRSDPRSDPDLVAAAGHGDMGALGALYDRHVHAVWRLLQRAAADPAEVDDIVQRTFMAVPRLAPRYDGRDSCRGWLCGVALGLAARQRRSLGRLLRGIASFALASAGGAAPDPARDAETHEEIVAFDRAFRRLAPKKREAFVLVELEGMSIVDAAEALNVPPATVRTRLFHARRELRDAMRRSGTW